MLVWSVKNSGFNFKLLKTDVQKMSTLSTIDCQDRVLPDTLESLMFPASLQLGNLQVVNLHYLWQRALYILGFLFSICFNLLVTFTNCIKQSQMNIQISLLMMLNHRPQTKFTKEFSLLFHFNFQKRLSCSHLGYYICFLPLAFPLSLGLPLLIQHEDTTPMNQCVKSNIFTLYKLGYHLLISSLLQSKVLMLPPLVSQQSPDRGSMEPWNIS